MKYEKILVLYHWIWRHWREQRWNRFQEYIAPTSTDVLLDVGGAPSEWIGRGSLIRNVDILNLDAYPINQQDDSPCMRSFRGDGRSLEFENGSYDIIYSNSVIEHVGTWEDQQAFASEVRRVGRQLWIQTPAYECPIEPHYLGLFIHWFPSSWHAFLARWTSLVGLLAKDVDIRSIAKSTRLLTKREYQLLFPDCKIWTERLFLIFPKSYVAIRNKHQNRIKCRYL